MSFVDNWVHPAWLAAAKAWYSSRPDEPFDEAHALVLRGEAGNHFRACILSHRAEIEVGKDDPFALTYRGLPVVFRWRDASGPGVEIMRRDRIEAIIEEEDRNAELARRMVDHLRRSRN